MNKHAFRLDAFDISLRLVARTSANILQIIWYIRALNQHSTNKFYHPENHIKGPPNKALSRLPTNKSNDYYIRRPLSQKKPKLELCQNSNNKVYFSK